MPHSNKEGKKELECDVNGDWHGDANGGHLAMQQAIDKNIRKFLHNELESIGNTSFEKNPKNCLKFHFSEKTVFSGGFGVFSPNRYYRLI